MSDNNECLSGPARQEAEQGQQPRPRSSRLADFLFEVGMLRRTPRSGYQFLGSGAENVAEHSFSAAFVGYVLGDMAGLDPCRVAMLCLMHDLHEARTGDLNYVNHMYVKADARAAMRDAVNGTGLEGRFMPMWEELECNESPEARLAHDADQLDLMLRLKEQMDMGNRYASKWLEAAEKRLRTPEGKELARSILAADHTDWWYAGADRSWWENRNKK